MHKIWENWLEALRIGGPGENMHHPSLPLQQGVGGLKRMAQELLMRVSRPRALSIQPKLSKIWKERQMVQKFPGNVSRNSGNCWTSKIQTIQRIIPAAKMNGKKTSRKKFQKFGYTSRSLSSLLKILENAIPFATGSWQKFKVDGLVEWKEPPKLYYNWLNNQAGHSLNWGTRSVGMPHIPPGHAENVRKCNVTNLGFCACFPQWEYHIKDNNYTTYMFTSS